MWLEDSKNIIHCVKLFVNRSRNKLKQRHLSLKNLKNINFRHMQDVDLIYFKGELFVCEYLGRLPGFMEHRMQNVDDFFFVAESAEYYSLCMKKHIKSVEPVDCTCPFCWLAVPIWLSLDVYRSRWSSRPQLVSWCNSFNCCRVSFRTYRLRVLNLKPVIVL